MGIQSPRPAGLMRLDTVAHGEPAAGAPCLKPEAPGGFRIDIEVTRHGAHRLVDLRSRAYRRRPADPTDTVARTLSVKNARTATLGNVIVRKAVAEAT